MKIAIDAGHGSQTSGKRTPDGYREHWINVRCAYFCEELLKENGISTIRVGWDDTNAKDDGDVALSTRQKQIKSAKCDYSVSFHANAYGATWNGANGVETLIHSRSAYQRDSRKFAEKLQAHLIQGTKQSNRGVKTQTLAMCNCVAMGVKAAALVEVGFMTNQSEAGLMKTDAFCKEQGEDVARGIMEYIGVSPKSNTSAAKPDAKVPVIPKKNTTLRATATKAGVQKYLNTHYGNAIAAVIGRELDEDGKFGTKSKKGLCIAIQTELNAHGAGISVDANFGSGSSAAWNKYFGSLKSGSRGIGVTLAQCLLVGFGYNPNGIDGIAGNGFKNATNQLLKSLGLTQNGAIVGSVVAKLL